LTTKVVLKRLSDAGQYGDTVWTTEPTRVSDGIYVSRTVVPDDRLDGIPVRIMNVKAQPMTVRAGANVANLQQAEVLGPMPVVEASSQHTEASVVAPDQDRPESITNLVSRMDDTLPESVRSMVSDVLQEYLDVFSKSENDLGVSDVVTHKIDTGGAAPIIQPLRRYPPAHLQAINEHVDNMLDQGVVEPATSPWASNLVLVRKKDGSYRCCVDYRPLNAVTRKDAYPLPRIDVCLDAMASAKWFSIFDLRSAYHQAMVNPADSDKTAFICHRGMYKFRRMPFGLCNSGATFQRLMDIVMSGLHFQVCLIYLDDIIIFSETTDQHLSRLTIVLDRLRTAGLKLKAEKCVLFQKSVTFLGHVVSGNGIATDPEKIRAVKEWPLPAFTRELRGFLGLAGYYRRFIADFASMAKPLHAMTGKGKKFCWTPEAGEAFQTLKGALTSAPVLVMPTDSDELVVDADASFGAIGCVLSQRQEGQEKVIAYASRCLDRREVNYCVTRKELLSIVYSLRHWKQYLLGRRFVIRTDHSALTWLRRTPDPIGQQARWLEIMEEFDFVIEHRPGQRHGNADALSRRPCRLKNCACHGGEDIQEDHRSRQEVHSEVTGFFGGSADYQGTERECAEVVYSVVIIQ